MTIAQEEAATGHWSTVLLSADEAKAFERALVGAEYWLNCSEHEQTPEDAIAMARFIQMIAPRIGTPV